MNDTQQQIQEIEITMEQAKVALDRRDAIRRLESNADFKLIIGEGYFEKEAIRLVALKADANMQDETNQVDIIKQIDSIGSLREYLRGIYYFGNMADRSLAADQETHAELLNEEATA